MILDSIISTYKQNCLSHKSQF